MIKKTFFHLTKVNDRGIEKLAKKPLWFPLKAHFPNFSTMLQKRSGLHCCPASRKEFSCGMVGQKDLFTSQEPVIFVPIMWLLFLIIMAFGFRKESKRRPQKKLSFGELVLVTSFCFNVSLLLNIGDMEMISAEVIQKPRRSPGRVCHHHWFHHHADWWLLHPPLHDIREEEVHQERKQ